MLRTIRGLCLVCLCILGIAVILAALEFAALPLVLKSTGCSVTEILPSLACGEGWVRRSMEVVLNLPFLFIYAVLFTFAKNGAPGREFMLLLYAFDAILILAIMYPPLLYLARRGRTARN